MDVKELSTSQSSILVIDDDDNFCQLVRSRANALKLQVDCFKSLYEVKNMAQINDYGVIVLDFYIGRETAVQLIDYLSSFCTIPIVVISAVPLDVITQKKFPNIVKYCWVKSIGTEELLLRCKSITTQSQPNEIWMEKPKIPEWQGSVFE